MASAPATNPLPCDGDGNCMACGKKPSEGETLNCKTCGTPWHGECLLNPPELSSTEHWECPDCDTSLPATKTSSAPSVVSAGAGPTFELIAAIKEIESDASLTDKEKARKRQELLSGKSKDDDASKTRALDDNGILSILGDNLKCSFCMLLPERPVTTPCGHNFCLKCFEKWVNQGKRTCAKCRYDIPSKMISQPRINSSLVYAIRMARAPQIAKTGAPRVMQFIGEEERPDTAFTTDKAKKTGLANARSGRIFVTIPGDHFGPILAENDPVKGTGVLVGDTWTDRLACRQWGAHFPHVSGIAGQSNVGAQSVVLSGGYEDDKDNGEWFLYTGSGGRDLSGNKRTNKLQSSDQKFTKANEALRVSCLKGYPVRVVRSAKDKHSNYAPEEGVRYDGVYRIEKCWRSNGNQGFKVCRYLFVRCDNSPAPWTGDECGDRPRPLPDVPELKRGTDITVRKSPPHWDFDEAEGCWKWKKPPPASKATPRAGEGGDVKGNVRFVRKALAKSSREKILKEFNCLLCRKVMNLPVTTPCAHNFCKSCLEEKFTGQAFTRERNRGGRQLRTQKNVMNCPICPTDISEFLQNVQVNRELMGAIESIMKKLDEEEKEAAMEAEEGVVEGEEGKEAAMEEEEGIVEGEEGKEVTMEAEEGVPEGEEEDAAVSGKGDISEKEDESDLSEEKETGEEDEHADDAEAKDTGAAIGRGKKRASASATGGRGRKSQRGDSPSSPLQVRV